MPKKKVIAPFPADKLASGLPREVGRLGDRGAGGRCFVMQPFDRGGPFDRRFDDFLAPAIRAAGLEPYRVDCDPASQIPIEDIAKGIRSARLCVADVSTRSPNVAYELGFAIAVGKPVVLIAKQQARRWFNVGHRRAIPYEGELPASLRALRASVTASLRQLLEAPEPRDSGMHSTAVGGIALLQTSNGAVTRPRRPRLRAFRAWVAAKIQTTIEELVGARVAEYSTRIRRFRLQDSGEAELEIQPLTRGDFLAHVFAAFTAELQNGDEYRAFSTFEFWDSMAPIGAGTYSEANLRAIHRARVRRIMLLRSGQRIDFVMTSETDRSAQAVRKRLAEHENEVGSKGSGSYSFQYAYVDSDEGYYHLRDRYHKGVFKFVFGDRSFYLVLTPVYYGSHGETSRTRLEKLVIRVYDDATQVSDLLAVWDTIDAAGAHAVLRAGKLAVPVRLFASHRDYVAVAQRSSASRAVLLTSAPSSPRAPRTARRGSPYTRTARP
jgi:hypothetical protein